MTSYIPFPLEPGLALELAWDQQKAVPLPNFQGQVIRSLATSTWASCNTQSRAMVLSARQFCFPDDIWQCLETVFGLCLLPPLHLPFTVNPEAPSDLRSP